MALTRRVHRVPVLVANGQHRTYRSPMARVQLQPAYVLHGRAYRESSQLLEIFTRDHGRIGAVARGARGPKSKLRNVLQPFRPLLVSYSQRRELATLTGADQVAAPPQLMGEALYCGLYINELMIRLMHRGDPHPEVFERYQQTLAQLTGDSPVQPSLRLFEKHLLEATGFGLILDHEYNSTDPITSDAWYEYKPERGPVRVGESARDRAGVVSGKALQSLQSEVLDEDDLPSLRKMMRRVIRHHLGDKPLASEALYLPARASAGQPGVD